MADIRPFRGVRYNQTIVNDMANAICPPYDIISPQLQSELYWCSEYNFVRLEYARELPKDTASENKYTRSAAVLAQWLAQGVLTVDEEPAIYLHDHHFRYQGRGFRRRGLIALVRLEEWESRVVRPHEGTLASPRSDRLTLLRTLQSNTSSILALFEDPGQRLALVVAAAGEKGATLIDFSTGSGEKHVVRAISGVEVVRQIRQSLGQQPLYIADGHHRYESALAYRREQIQNQVGNSGGCDYVMMTLVDIADPGLVILPLHRLVGGLPEDKLEGIADGLASYFQIQELPLGLPDVWQQVRAFLEEAGEGKIVFLGQGLGSVRLLQPRDSKSIRSFMPESRSEHYKKLAVSILDHVILENLLGLRRKDDAGTLAYGHDQSDAVKMVQNGQYQMAFLLGPTKAEVIRMIADDGDRMPGKSTYFYPKLPSGLVFHRMADG